jgi:hypothetical protein
MAVNHSLFPRSRGSLVFELRAGVFGFTEVQSARPTIVDISYRVSLPRVGRKYQAEMLPVRLSLAGYCPRVDGLHKTGQQVTWPGKYDPVIPPCMDGLH